jgi:Co/Zn/Cd efflux system component
MSDESEINSRVEFWIVGVMITVVSMVGIIGNIICILMFHFKRLNINQTFASLLKWLAVVDSVFLVSCYSLDEIFYDICCTEPN